MLMGLLRFDPDSMVRRALASKRTLTPLTLGQSMFLGGVNFMCVSLVAFSIWAFAGKDLSKSVGEGGFYAVCALAFVALSGMAFYPLIIGRNSLGRFYLLFTGAFLAYAFVWSFAWFKLSHPLGPIPFGPTLAGWVGSSAGTLVMTLIISNAFDERKRQFPAFVILFFGNAVGYFLGEDIHGFVRSANGERLLSAITTKDSRATIAMLAWGLTYGAGTGIGLGAVFYICQETTRQRLAEARALLKD